MQTSRIAKAKDSAKARRWPDMPSRIGRSCRPISTKASTLSTKIATSHTEKVGSRRLARSRRGPLFEIVAA